MIIDCISDLHGHYPKLEGGDLLIVAGDLTARDTPGEYFKFFHWIANQPYKKRIVIAGNHDTLAQEVPETLTIPNADFEYLCDSGTEFEGLKIWGTPWSLKFEGMNPHCMAFTVDTEEDLAEKWALIPDDINILITHSPPYGMFDEVDCVNHCTSFHTGSPSLLRYQSNHLDTLKFHVWGHIHEGYGRFDIRQFQKEFNGKRGLVFANASHVNQWYEPVNPPIRVIL